MEIICPITKKKYERYDFCKYHSQDCPYCNSIEDKRKLKKKIELAIG